MSVEYNPNKLGWPAAAVTVAGALGLLFTAYSIHQRTYRHPRDPMAQQVFYERDAAGGGHGAAAGAEHATTEGKASEAQAPAAAIDSAAKPKASGHE
ncbi:MAG: hypothetical protein ABIW79_03675 [Gemmatimonas sp.]